MALFGHDDNVRRLSSNLSTGQNFDEDVVGPDGEIELSGKIIVSLYYLTNVLEIIEKKLFKINIPE